MRTFVDDFLDQSFDDFFSKPDLEISEGTTISNIVKEYPSMLKVVIYHDSYTLPRRTYNPDVRKLEKASRRQDSIDRSVRRSRMMVKDIIACNSWDYWCTFTFSPKKVDRLDFDQCRRKMSLWLDRQKQLRYIIVPELHKNGAIHFHALLANYHGTLKDTGKTTQNGHRIFKPNYKGGISEFVELDNNTDAIASYMTKQYITKDMIKFYGRKRYTTSRNLQVPTSTVNGLSKFNLWSIIKSSKPEFINESYELYYLKKDSNFPLDSSNQTALL